MIVLNIDVDPILIDINIHPQKMDIKFSKLDSLKELITKVIYIILVLFVILNIIFLVNTTIKKSDYFNLMGISLFSMESDLMGDEIPKNSLVVTRKYNANDNVDVNDNIAYVVNGKIRINKVVSTEVIDGKVIYHTKSNNNYFSDKEEVSRNEVIGKVIGVIPFLGILLKILQSKITTVIIIIILIMKFLYNKNMYKRRIKRKKTLR